MNIYIDESGIFGNPANKDNVASCVGALAIPSSQRKDIIKGFKRLISTWNLGEGEVKGSKLNESQISEVIGLLKRYDVIFDLAMMDLGLLEENDITAFKLKSADGITSNITSRHHPRVVAQANELKEDFLKMSNPLFVQAGMLNVLIPHLVQNMLTYYSFRIPEEIGSFNWVVDAKDKFVTNYEKTWSTVIYPYIYAQSIKSPLYCVEGGDYTHFDKHLNSEKRTQELAREHPQFEEGEIVSMQVRSILGGGMKFKDSKTNYGLQLVDILVNAAQRALNGKLKIDGWGELGALMISEAPYPVRVITFDINAAGARSITTKSPFAYVVDQCRKKAKPMFLSCRFPEMNPGLCEIIRVSLGT